MWNKLDAGRELVPLPGLNSGAPKTAIAIGARGFDLPTWKDVSTADRRIAPLRKKKMTLLLNQYELWPGLLNAVFPF